MDSFFINPYSGGYGSNAPMPINYNDYNTNAEAQRQAAEAARMETLRREQRSDDNYERLLNQMGQQVSGSSLTQQEMARYAETIAPGSGYDPKTQVLNEAQRRYINSPEGAAARLAQEDIAMGAVGSNQMGFYDNLKMLQNQEPSFQNPSGGMAYYNTFPDADGNPTRRGYDSTGGSYGGSLVTGGLSGNLTGLPEVGLLGFGGGIADNVYPAINFEGAVDSQSKDFAAKAAAGGFDPSAIDYDFNATPAPALTPALTVLPEQNVVRETDFYKSQLTDKDRIVSDLMSNTDQYDLASAESARFAAAKQAADDAQVVAQREAQELAIRNEAALVAQEAARRRDNSNPTPTYTGGVVRDSKGNAVKDGSGNAVRAPGPNVGSGGGGGGNGGGGSSKILCCAYYELGYLPREIWRLDQRYGVWLHRNNKKLMNGYHAWAAPLADFVKRDTVGGKVARKVMWPIVKAWAEEMAHTMSPEKHKSNKVGKVIATVGEAFSYAVGAVLLPKNNKKEA